MSRIARMGTIYDSMKGRTLYPCAAQFVHSQARMRWISPPV